MNQWLNQNPFSSILPRKYRANKSRSKRPGPSASVARARLFDLPHHSPSLISLTRSEGDSPLYAPSLVQDPSVIDLPSQSDIIIAYVDQTFKLLSKTQNPTVS